MGYKEAMGMMTVLICPQCKTLLIETDSWARKYDRDILCEHGYDGDSDDSEPEFIDRICIDCGWSIKAKGKNKCLKEIQIPKAAVKALRKLYRRLYMNHNNEHKHGIPLDNAELKGLLTEYLL